MAFVVSILYGLKLFDRDHKDQPKVYVWVSRHVLKNQETINISENSTFKIVEYILRTVKLFLKPLMIY